MAHPHAAESTAAGERAHHAQRLAFPSLVLGCNGLLSGSGSVFADLQAWLFRAVHRNDLAEAKHLNDRIEPTSRVFYADPFVPQNDILAQPANH
jgi:dihydrodipicolinate synthase/N-acetylneuraminate lyase